MKKTLYTKQIVIVVIAAVILAFICFLPKIFLWAVSPDPDLDGLTPEDGLWYCKELQLQLSFIPQDYSTDDTLEGYETYSYMMTDLGCVMCSFSLPARSRNMLVLAQDDAYVEMLAEVLFRGQYISADGQCLVIRGEDGADYRFLRLGTFSATTFLEEYENQAEESGQPQQELKFVELVIQYAASLWKNQLSVIEAMETDDFIVSFDPDNRFWLVSCAPTESAAYYALISDSGDYYSVWTEIQNKSTDAA